MPRAHLNLLIHVDFSCVLFLSSGRSTGRVRHDLLALVGPVVAHIFAAFVHELHVNLTVCLVLDIYNVHVRVVAAGEHHVRVRRYLQIELVKDIFALIYFTQLLFEVVGHVEHLAWLSLVPDVPNLNAKIVTRINVAVVDR